MTDDLEKLRDAFRAATPAPNGAARARAQHAAMEMFRQSQGSVDAKRQTVTKPRKPGPMTGVVNMLTRLATRPALAGGTALVAAAAAVIMVQLPLPDLAVAPPKRIVSEPLIVAEEAEAKAAPSPMAQSRERFSLAPLADSMDGAVVGAIAEPDRVVMRQQESRDSFANASPNPVRVTAEEPVSTFSIDVDTASWAYVRSAINHGSLPPKDAVRIEEMVNYFTYDYTQPVDGRPFAVHASVFETPWNPDTRLLRIGIQGSLPQADVRAPVDLVFLIDTSGSMNADDKLPLLRQSLRLALQNLGPDDRIAIVTYAGSSGIALPPTPASERAKIINALGALTAGGSTAGEAGLRLAYSVAGDMAAEGRTSRVILATDGDFNVGMSGPDEMTDFIAAQRETGTYLSVLGFGRGNLNDRLMQALAQNGNGQAAYIDTLAEARKALGDQFGAALEPIAGDVKIQVEFNPAAVAEYRLIGYETRVLAREAFNNDRVDAGEIGAGHQVTALYEIVAPGSPARAVDDLRYSKSTGAGDASELGFLRLRYKDPGASTSQLIEQPIANTTAIADADARFAAAIAGFGQVLRGETRMGDWSHAQAIDLARGAMGDDPNGYRREAVGLIELAASLSR